MACQRQTASEAATAEATARYASRYEAMDTSELRTELEGITGKSEFDWI